MCCKQETLAGLYSEIIHYGAPIREVAAEIVFGTPSRNCDGVGLCRMLAPVLLRGREIRCPHATAYCALDVERNVFTLRFPKSFLSHQMVARHFYKRLFNVTESYRVPGHIIHALGLQQVVIIQEGVYMVKETQDDWIVVISPKGIAG